MRLIDADALMQEFASRARAARNWKEGATMEGNSEAAIRADATLAFLSEVKLTIEKAPTVEQKYYERVVATVTFDRNQLNEIVEKAKAEILENIKRPQGEWIKVKPHQSDLEDGINYREECSICHEPNRHYGFDEYHDIRFATYYKSNFCPNCGARMKDEVLI